MFAPAFFGLLLAVSVSGHIVEMDPPELVRRVGQQASFVCSVHPSYKLDSCRLIVGTQTYLLVPNRTSTSVVYKGEGFESGQCGGEIKNVEESMDGVVTCSIPPPPDSTSNVEVKANATLIVASKLPLGGAVTF